MIITFTNQKGGVGKTTSAVNAAHGLARKGYDTVLVDLDPQGHDAISLGFDPTPGVFRWMVGDDDIADCVIETGRERLTLLPGNRKTTTAQTVYQSEPGGFDKTLAYLRALNMLADVVVVDTAAGGFFQEAAIAAAQAVVIPTHLEALAIDGVAATLGVVERLNPSAWVRILPTTFDRRVLEHGANLTLLRTAYMGRVAAYIPDRIQVPESAACGQTIWEYGKDKLLLEAYQDIVDWLAAEEVQHGR